MKNWKLYISLIVIGMLIIALIRQCNSEAPKVKNKGAFEPKTNIKHIVIHDTVTSKEIVYKYLSKNDKSNFFQKQIDSLLTVNEKMNTEFATATDSLQKELCKKAISIKAFQEHFNNDTINIEVNGLVSGEVKALNVNYELTLPKQKEVVFRLLGGAGFGINKDLNQSLYKANLGFQNKKGKIYEASYLRIGTQQYGVLSLNVPILTIKR